MSVYVLDTSALLAYIENEDGVTEIESILLETLDDRHTLYVSVVSCIEIFYISFQEQGRMVATERLELLKELPLIQEPLDENYIAAVGAIKAAHAMSFADCCIADWPKRKMLSSYIKILSLNKLNTKFFNTSYLTRQKIHKM